MNGVFLSSVNDLWETTRQRSAAPPGIPPQSQPYGGAGGSKGNGNGGFSGTGPGSAQNPIHSVTSAGSSSRSVLGVWNHHNSLGVKATPLDNLRYLQQINRECQAQVAHQGHDCPMVGLRPFTHRASSDRNNMVLGSLSPEVGTGGPRAGGGDHHQYSNLEVPFASVRGVTGLPAAADQRGGQRDDEGGRPTDNSAIGGGEDNHNNTTRFSWGTDDAPSEIGRPEGRLGGRGSWLSSGPEGDESEGASEMMRGSPAGFMIPPLPGGIPGGGAEEGRGRAGGRYPSSSSDDDDDEDTSEEDEEEEEDSSSSPSSGGSSSEGDSIPSQISPINHSAHHAPHHVGGNDSSWDASPPL